MAEMTGESLYARFGSVIFSGRYRVFSEGDEVVMRDVSCYGDDQRNFVTELEDNAISVQTLQEAGGEALWAALEPSSQETLAWVADGATMTLVSAMVKSRKRNIVYDDVVKIDVTFVYTDQPTVRAYTGPESLITLGIGSDASVTWLVLTGLHAEAA